MPERPTATHSLSWRVVLGSLAAGGVLLIVAAQVYLTAQPIDAEELARRCRQATPAWTNYDEDIKSQIGARPFAEWKGEPIMAYRDEDGLAVVFMVADPWAGRDTAMPVLIRDALGAVHRDSDWRRDGHHVVYRFPTDDESASLALQSIEVRYPHHTRRIIVIDRTQSAE